MPLSPVVSIVVTMCFPWYLSISPVLRRPADADVLDLPSPQAGLLGTLQRDYCFTVRRDERRRQRAG